MQGRENTSGDLMQLRCVFACFKIFDLGLTAFNTIQQPTTCQLRRQRISQRNRWLDGSSPCFDGRAECVTRILTPVTTSQQLALAVREYHGTYYVPHNLCLIVCGKLASGTSSLLSVVQDRIEPTLIAHGQNKGPRPDGWKRPFLETVTANRKPIAKTIKETVEFPEQDESVGELIISFLGPPPSAFLERKALDIIGTYLTSSAVAPLNKEYVEIDNPLWYVTHVLCRWVPLSISKYIHLLRRRSPRDLR
jgi:hypothetical protein